MMLAVLVQANAQLSPQSFSAIKSPEDAGFSVERLQRLDALMQSFVAEGLAPNVAVFVARNGKVVSYKGYGYRNLETKTPLQKDDLFRIASQSKAIATVALMTLFEQGKFLLDDPISKYIPEFKAPRVLESFDAVTGNYETRPAKSEITIRQLLSHSAGIPYEHPLDKLPAFKVPFFNSTQPDVLADVVKKIAARPLIADPGEKFVYGLNTDVIGYLIEILSGKKLDVYLKEAVTAPLGMNDTYFYLPADKAGRLVELYSKQWADKPLVVSANNDYRFFATTGARTYFSAGAGLISSVEDYAKFCQMLLNFGRFNNRQILGRKTVEMMFRNQIGSSDVWTRQDKFGLGLQIMTEQSRYSDNASTGSLTWGGMYCSEYTIDPKENLILLVFTNVEPYAHYSDLVHKFRISVYQALR
ncbi:beta-lactamase family protein [Chryseolinea sp. Jin1]|uniref:Beta-lactamase family protein n=2 Tax=Chryseolinea lacunae TaxID=2801331 RepID=A0ABS1KM10_9BACT|nr:beta-lactamase family protein [Chryseolinea lacunae]